MKKRSQSNSVDKPIGNRTKKSNSKRSAIIINDEYDS